MHVDFKANDLWRMTNQLDLRVLATIGAIVKDFAYNLRPTLNPPFNEATTFRAWLLVSSKVMLDDENYMDASKRWSTDDPNR